MILILASAGKKEEMVGNSPNGKNEKLGVCPAAQSSEMNGVNSSKLGGRFCWNFDKTFCKEVIMESNEKKIPNRFECLFFIVSVRKKGRNLSFDLELMRDKIPAKQVTP